MNPLASPPYDSEHTAFSSSYSTHPIDPEMRSLLASTWQVLEQPPPPSLREILGAYKSKGDGDRDMLLAMLQAKSAEDQRIASMASLHRTMLDIHQTAPSPQLPQLSLPHGARHPPFSPPAHQSSFSPLLSRKSPSISPKITLPSIRDHTFAEGPRKRIRTSPSPPPPALRNSSDPQPTAAHDLPPSPYSSSDRSLSAESSQSQQRGSMAIGSLLSSSGPTKENDEAWMAQTSSERTSSRVNRDYPPREQRRRPTVAV